MAVASLAPTTEPGLLGWDRPDDAIVHSDDRPSWIVSVEGDDADERADNLSALRDWVASANNRELIPEREHEGSGVATIISSPSDIGARNRERWLGDGLQSLSYIDSIELNRSVSLADPLTPESSSAWSSPGPMQSLLLSTFADGSPGSSGVAFDSDMDGGEMTNAREATSATATDLTLPDTSSVTVAVVDTGVSANGYLEDDSGNTRLLDSSTNFVEDGDPSGVGETRDGNGHGDWVAACYAANTDDRLRGFLPEANVLACKALSDAGSGSLSDIAAAIRHAADEGADLINLSLGSPQFSQSIEDALSYAVKQGSIPVAANGNDRQATRWLAFPASSENAIAVGSTTVDPPEDARSAYYSNVGPHNGYTDLSEGATAGAEPDVGAPGCKLESASGDTLTGTSMAGPVAGGVIGLYVADTGTTDLETVRDELTATAEPIPNAASEEIGAGMPNAENLLSGTEPDEPQEDAVTTEAASRGAAYDFLSGSRYTRLIANF
ncbi:peptidase S8 and S53 subtilisin kexin sedolisin [Natrialba aegyptia DSM 13077]|uniref:Peptidase S8 and S53 subtilisin kexin sedolisin n=2 Tax=Natrialba aegyptia TaxID=129789 RepID=M0B5C4_9EURY|nr:peptidase S8 and S53 subtilisin kexin sedolisin [Natrialba aegyptia DSM 13077]